MMSLLVVSEFNFGVEPWVASLMTFSDSNRGFSALGEGELKRFVTDGSHPRGLIINTNR
jgi:hypothetical protein